MAPRKSGGAVEPVAALSATGLTRLSECEVRFLWRPADDAPELAKGRALDLGTAVHALVEARLRGQDWRAKLLDLAVEAAPRWDPSFNLPEPLDTAEWLMNRHEQVYPTMPQAIATEGQFELWLPDAPVPTKVRGRNDGIVLLTESEAQGHGAGLYLWETKTMGKWDRLDWLSIDPQLGTYFWAADQQGMVGVRGVVYEAILTTHWKTPPDEPKGHPITDSFRRLILPRNEALVNETLRQYRVAAQRVAEIQADPSRAVKAAGRNCTYCPAYKDCHPYA